jgi:hypothetical protein
MRLVVALVAEVEIPMVLGLVSFQLLRRWSLVLALITAQVHLQATVLTFKNIADPEPVPNQGSSTTKIGIYFVKMREEIGLFAFVDRRSGSKFSDQTEFESKEDSD